MSHEGFGYENIKKRALNTIKNKNLTKDAYTSSKNSKISKVLEKENDEQELE